MQLKPNPFNLALEVIIPTLAPSFEIRSVRDTSKKPTKYPAVEYVIIGGQSQGYDPGTNMWRGEYLYQLDFLVKESQPLDWCQYEELKDAQDRQALFTAFEDMIKDFLVAVIRPSKLYPNLRDSDAVYHKYDFKLVSVIGVGYQNKKGPNNLTGTSVQFILSHLSESNICCVVSDDSPKSQWEKTQKMFKEGSVSYRLIQNKIDAL